MLEQIKEMFGINIVLKGDADLRLIRAGELSKAKQTELLKIAKAHKAEIIQELKSHQQADGYQEEHGIKAYGFAIEKLSSCLDDLGCEFLSLVNGKQVCRKTDRSVFDMSECPAGRWWRAEAGPMSGPSINTEQPKICYTCKGKTFWRRQGCRGPWVCGVCHPPVFRKDEVEWLQ